MCRSVINGNVYRETIYSFNHGNKILPKDKLSKEGVFSKNNKKFNVDVSNNSLCISMSTGNVYGNLISSFNHGNQIFPEDRVGK